MVAALKNKGELPHVCGRMVFKWTKYLEKSGICQIFKDNFSF